MAGQCLSFRALSKGKGVEGFSGWNMPTRFQDPNSGLESSGFGPWKILKPSVDQTLLEGFSLDEDRSAVA